MKPQVEQANIMSRSSASAPAVSSDPPVPTSFQTFLRSGLTARALTSLPCHQRVCLYGQGSIGHVPLQDIVMQVIFLAPFFPRWNPLSHPSIGHCHATVVSAARSLGR
eukprot:449433-Prymnesium_polylepis.1